MKAKPSEVAFHFKRLLRVLEWNPRSYLGSEMYKQWMDSLADEARQTDRRIARHEARIQRNERKLLKLSKLHMQKQTEGMSSHSASRRSSTTISDGGLGQNGSLMRQRRHSVYSYDVAGTAARSLSINESHQEDLNVSLLDSPGRRLRRGLFSRLARSKNVSHGEDLDKLPNLLEKQSAVPMKKSVSVPSLSTLDFKTNDFATDFNIHEGDL